MSTSKAMRLDQLLSRCGYCSRREARAWLKAGRVTVAGEEPRSADEKVLPEDVRIDGDVVECPDGIVAVLHKPAGYVCSHDAREGPTVYDLLPTRWSERNPAVSTVGRLDKDTTGVLLLTDLGEWIQRWTSPRHKVPKVYEVTLDREPQRDLIPLFASGTLQIPDEDDACLPAQLEITGERTARLELIEGKYHQVKRMFATVGCNVVGLHRSRFGNFTVEGLTPGKWRLASPTENTSPAPEKPRGV